MSASVYANPYIYKPPPPRINYPSLFHGLNDITLRYILDSKILALAVLILGVAVLIILAVVLMPFWFKLVLDPVQGTFGTEPVKRELTINTGLFYMRWSHHDNIANMDKYTNAQTVPPVLQAAQAFCVLGFCTLVGCFGASIILLLRRFASVTALMILAGATTLSAACQILVILCCAALVVQSSCDPYDGSGCNYHDNLEWSLIPLYSQFYRVEPNLTPYVQADWAFYIAIIGALVNIGGAVMVWIEAFMNYRSLRQIRYQQLKEYRDPYEKEIDPHTGQKFRYQPPTRPGPNMYGMQPIIMSDHPYEGMVIEGPPSDVFVPQASFAPQPRPPSPGFGRRYGPPSSTGSISDQPSITREIDL